MRRTQEQTQQTRRTLMDAAYRLFRERGYEAVTQDQIAREAGVTRGCLNWHFQGKEEIYLAILREVMDRLAELRAQELRQTGTAEEKLIRYFCSIREKTAEWFNFLNAIPASLREKEPFLQIEQRRAQNMKDSVRTIYGFLEAIESERGSALNADKRDMAQTLFYLYQGLSYSRRGDEEEAAWEAEIRRYIRLILR